MLSNLQGGNHNPLSHFIHPAADQVIQYFVVTANESQNVKVDVLMPLRFQLLFAYLQHYV